MKKIVTHNNRFHADDVFAAATLKILFEDIKKEDLEIIRTRDEEIINSADVVIDVGGIYDSETNRFDHHQSTFNEERENGIPYASFGLVWKEFGEEICGSKEAAEIIDRKIVQPVDAGDNGVTTFIQKIEGVSPYLVSSMLYSFMPSWKEEDISLDDAFIKAVNLAKNVLEREIKRIKDFIEAKEIIKNRFDKSENKQIIVFEKEDKFSDEDIQAVLIEETDPLVYIRYREDDDNWSSKTVRDNSDPNDAFKNRCDFPKEWSGLRKKDLAKVSGIEDAVFCHKALFLSVAKSKESAIEMANAAVSLVEKN